ncbi:unnamed protein product [Rotaria sp. Silwood2]|nr:unnamed protein product [Rotaria sp. Silwood2]CAF4385556.1 unnamed protein product [Rotaria sp. Silwood2]
MSFNKFLSTSTNFQTSHAFAESNKNSEELIGILFEITIDCSISSTPFANISHMSHFPEENEILFSTHTIFRIGDISEMDDSQQFWRVKLMLTGDNDDELNALTERMREEIQGLTGFHRLGQLLIKVGEFNKAEHVYNNIVETTTDACEKALIYNQLCHIKDNCGDYTNAIVFYEKSLEIHHDQQPSNDIILAVTYNNLGLVYHNKGEFPTSISFYEKTLEIYEKNPTESYSKLALTYCNIQIDYVIFNSFVSFAVYMQ